MSFDASVLDRIGVAAGLALSIRATLVLVLGAAVAWLLRHRSAAARHFVWLLTLNAVLGVTVFATLPRGLAVAVPRWPQWAVQRRAVLPSVEPRNEVGDVPEATRVTRDAGGDESAHGATPLPTGPPLVLGRLGTLPDNHLRPMDLSEALPVPPPSAGPRPNSRAPSPIFRAQLLGRLAAVVSPGLLLIVLWLAGTCLVLGWLALGHLGLAWIARRSEAVEDPAWRTLLRRLAHEAGVAQAPRLCWSAAVGAPLACGLLRPSILLPVEAASWGAERRRVVLLHELAHIARRDPLTQSIAWLACAIYWFLPAAWLAFTRLRAESERACDDRVLSSGVAAPDYASHLLGVARRARALRLAGAVSVAMARRSTLEGRLLALLDDGVRRGALGVRARGAGIAALAVVLIALGLVRPVPPAAAVAPDVSSEPVPAAAPATHLSEVDRASGSSNASSPAPTAHRALATPAEPAAGLATDSFAATAVNPSTAPATDPSAALAVDPPAAPAPDQSAAPERAEAGAAVARSAMKTLDVAGDKTKAVAESFHSDPPAKPGDTPAPDSQRGAPPLSTRLVLPGLLASAPTVGRASSAGVATWINPAGGLWSNPKNWTPANVPDAAGESAVLPALSGAYQVTLDISPNVDAISIAADATLDVSGFSIAGANLVNNSGTIRNFAGGYTSTKFRNLTGGTVLVAPGGTIEILDADLWNAGTIVAAREIHWGGSVILHGGGTLVLDDTRLFDPNNDPNPKLPQGDLSYMTISAGTTLRGTGKIDKDRITNSGLIQADVAQLAKVNNATPPEKVLWFNGTITNNGTIRVMNDGHINVNRPSIFNRDGVITSGPGGGSLRLEMPFKMFGTISSLPTMGGLPPTSGGILRADGGDLTLGIMAMYMGRFQRGPGGGAVKLAHVTIGGATVEAGAEVDFEPRTVYGSRDAVGAIVPDAPVLNLGGVNGDPEGVVRITNNGTIRFTQGLFSNSWWGGQTLISGTGELILDGATIGSGAGGTFVNGAGHTIRGCGTINAPFLNEGTVALECSGGKSARIGGQPAPAKYTPEGQVTIPGASIENRGKISIARGDLSISGPAPARYPLEVAAPTVVTNKGTISAAGGRITLEKAVTLDNTRGGVLSAAGGIVSLGATTGATVIGGRLVAGPDAKAQKAGVSRGGPAFAAAVFEVQKSVTLRDVTLGPAATLITAAGGVTTASGSRVVNEGMNRIAGTFVVTPGTAYYQTTGETVLEGGELLGAIMHGPGRGEAGISGATITSAPATLQFYARNEARSASFVLELPHAADVEGRVYDAAGREVARIADGPREAGVHRFALGRSGGAGLTNGIYFGRMVVTNAGVREVLQSRIAVIN